MQLFVSLTQPYRWVRLNRRGATIGHGLFNNLSEAKNYRRDECIGVIPGEDCSTHHVEVPTRNRKKLMAAIPFALEEALSEDVDDLTFHIIDQQPGRPKVVAVISQAKLEQWRELAQTSGLKLAGIIADYKLLPLPTEARAALANTDLDRICIHFNDKSGATLDQATFELWWQSQTEQQQDHATWEIGSTALAAQLELAPPNHIKGHHFGEWLKNRPVNQPVTGILKGLLDDDNDKSSKLLLGVAVLGFILAVLLKLGFDGYELYRLEQHNTALDHEVRTLFNETFPQVERIVDAPLQFSRQLDALQQGVSSSGDFQPLLYAAVRALTNSQARLEEINYATPSMTISCSVNDFAALDRLKQQLDQQAGIKATLVASGSLQNRVTGRFSLNRK